MDTKSQHEILSPTESVDSAVYVSHGSYREAHLRKPAPGAVVVEEVKPRNTMRCPDDKDVGSVEAGEGVQRTNTISGPPQSIWVVWPWEMAFCAISVVIFITIIAVLKRCDDNALPKLPLHVTLNTLLAFLTTLSKAALMMPVAEALSQWKWNWFRRSRSLLDFQTFDYASRGLWGSVSLLGTTRWRHIATIGAAVTIIGIVTSPITQQAIEYPERLVSVNDGAATTWAGNDLRNFRGEPYPVILKMLDKISQGLTSSWNNFTDVVPECSTAECTFPRFATLGVCTKVANITHLLNVTMLPDTEWEDWLGWGDRDEISLHQVSYNISLPQYGSWIVTPVAYTMNAFASNESFMFGDDPNLYKSMIRDMTIIYSNGPNISYPNVETSNATIPKFQAAEVAFHMCVKTLDVRVVNGQPETLLVDESHEVMGDIPFPLFKYQCGEWNTAKKANPFRCGYIPLHPEEFFLTLRGPEDVPFEPTRGNFTIHSRLLNEMSVGMQLGLTTFWNWNGREQSAETGASVGIKFVESIWGTTDGLQTQLGRIEKVARSIAIGATNSIRTMTPYTTVENSFPIKGTAWKQETYVHVRWGWLVFLGGQITIGILFMAFTIIGTQRSGTRVLKSSPLAVLFALNPDSRAAVGEMGVEADMKRRAAPYSASLLGNELVLKR